MWELILWQYFTVIIVLFNFKELKYIINWDDQDLIGRVIDYFNLVLDRVLELDEIVVGFIVLFFQGKYRG